MRSRVHTRAPSTWRKRRSLLRIVHEQVFLVWLVLLVKPLVTAAVYAELLARGALHSSASQRQQSRRMCVDARLALRCIPLMRLWLNLLACLAGLNHPPARAPDAQAGEQGLGGGCRPPATSASGWARGQRWLGSVLDTLLDVKVDLLYQQVMPRFSLRLPTCPQRNWPHRRLALPSFLTAALPSRTTRRRSLPRYAYPCSLISCVCCVCAGARGPQVARLSRLHALPPGPLNPPAHAPSSPARASVARV